MQVLNQTLCAVIVFFAYRKMGYYTLFGFWSALSAYFTEKKKLKGDVLTINYCGLPVGTLMASKDVGWLPTDTPFEVEMREIRTKYAGRLGYFGKFAVIPSFRKGMACGQLLEKAVTEWSFSQGVEVVVMMCHPNHAKWYIDRGAKRIGFTGGTAGLEKAPAVFLLLDYSESKVIHRCRVRYQQRKVQVTEDFEIAV